MPSGDCSEEVQPSNLERGRFFSRGSRWWIALAGLALLVVAGLGALWSSVEPTQDGKPVSYWISQLGTSGSGAEAALDKLGPEKSLGYLMRSIRGEVQQKPKWHRLYDRHYSQLPKLLRQRLPAPLPGPSRDRIEFAQSRAAYYLIHLADTHLSSVRIAIPELVSLLENSNHNTRFSAGIALSGFGTNAAPAIPVIENLLNEHPEKIHDIMLRLMEKCGPGAARALPTLGNCLASSNGLISIGCARTLWRLDPSQAALVRPVARKWTEAKDAGVRIESASLLWRMDRNPLPVVPVLIQLLKEDDHPFDYRSILLLKEIGPGATNAIPVLSERLKRKPRNEPFFLKAADEALQAMGASAKRPDHVDAPPP